MKKLNLKNAKKINFKNAKVQFASNELLNRYPDRVKTLLALIASYHCEPDEIEEWLNCCFISDQSSLSDFALNHSDLTEIGNKLGFVVQKRDLIHEIVLRMGQPN